MSASHSTAVCMYAFMRAASVQTQRNDWHWSLTLHVRWGAGSPNSFNV